MKKMNPSDLWKQAILLEKEQSKFAMSASEGLEGTYNVVTLDFDFSFDDIYDEDIEESKYKTEILYHEIFHMYQALTQPVVVSLSSLMRFNAGIISYLLRLFFNANNKIDLINTNSVLELREQIDIPQYMDDFFDYWSQEYCAFMDTFRSSNSYQMIETAAYLAQKTLTSSYNIDDTASEYYKKLHIDFCNKHKSLDIYDAIDYHLMILNLSLSCPIEMVEDVYYYLVKNFHLIQKQSTQLKPKTHFSSFDIVLKFYYQDNNFIESYHKFENKDLEERFNKFAIALFGSNLDRNLYIPEKLDQVDLNHEDLLYLLGLSELPNPIEHVKFILSAENFIKSKALA